MTTLLDDHVGHRVGVLRNGTYHCYTCSPRGIRALKRSLVRSPVQHWLCPICKLRVTRLVNPFGLLNYICQTCKRRYGDDGYVIEEAEA